MVLKSSIFHQFCILVYGVYIKQTGLGLIITVISNCVINYYNNESLPILSYYHKCTYNCNKCFDNSSVLFNLIMVIPDRL